jgi:hypothetical protein
MLHNHTGGGVKIAIFGQSIFYLECFNCDLILIEHRNKHIVSFFWTIGTHCSFLSSDRHVGCKVVLSANFLKSDTGKNYKISKKTDKMIPTTTCLFMQKT